MFGPLFWNDDMNTITWVQHAIGHGGFHCGQMVDKGGARFNWIFDCGAQNNKRFEDYLVLWTKRQNESVDWLFISHFDLDHVSGLDTLMSRCVIQDVMVPYVNEEELVYVLLGEIARGNLVRAFVELIADPADFFLSRGANRVIFLGGGSSIEPDEREDKEPPKPPDKPTAGAADKEDRGWARDISKQIKPLMEADWVDSRTGSSRVGVIEDGTCDITITGNSFGLCLIPYRAPMTHSVHTQLLADVQNLVGQAPPSSSAGRPGLRGLAYSIALHARTATGRAGLKALHKKYAGSSNRVSLSLLSKPLNFDPASSYCYAKNAFGCHSKMSGCAWMNTGDAELLVHTDLNDWEKCYSTHLLDVSVLALPHHGSDKNSDQKLQNLCPNAILTVHVKSTSKKHPGANVSSAAGKRLACVTEKKFTEILMGFLSA